jgi:hypothetical protein
MKNTNGASRFELDGEDITDALKPYKAVTPAYVAKQAEAGLEGNDQVAWRTLNLAHIDSINILGMEIGGKAEVNIDEPIENVENPVVVERDEIPALAHNAD